MKKNKLTFGLVAAMLSVGALTACNEVTAAEGVVLSYTDANGNKLDYTAADLFGSYQVGTSVANTDFTKIKEVLIRKYYESGSGKSSLESLKKKANNDVDGYKKEAKKNAESNGTSYDAEWEKILQGQDVENLDELFDKMLYNREKEDFDSNGYYGKSTVNKNQARDGVVYETESDGSVKYDERGNAVWSDKDFYPASNEFGEESRGYLEDQMPYHVTHVLLPVTGTSETNATTATINANEAQNLGEFLIKLAKGNKAAGSHNTTFNDIAKDYKGDPGSAANYGDLGIMDFSTSFVQGFQYGLYAYDAYFNTAANDYADALGLRDNLKPSDDGEYYNAAGQKVALETAFQAGGIYESIGEIPFGAAVALANEDVYSNFPSLGYRVNNGSETYYPRNIIFNKYFNTHKIAVITPDSIPFNDYEVVTINPDDGSEVVHYVPNAVTADAKTKILADGDKFTTETNVGTVGRYLTNDYPGFSRKVNIGGTARNVLTTEKGQVVLAVRGDSGTAGVHFIVVDRSPLSGYGTKLDADNTLVEITKAEYEANANTSDVTSLSEYYSMLNPVLDRSDATYASADAVKAAKTKGNKFPFYTVTVDGKEEAHNKSTYSYAHVESTDRTTYSDSISKLEGYVNSFNSSLTDSYTFQKLFEDGKITFNTENEFAKRVADLVMNNSKITRVTAHQDAIDKRDDAWTKYIEFLVQENASRAYREKGDQKLISETCAISYLSGDANPDNKTGLWAVGGACYAK